MKHSVSTLVSILQNLSHISPGAVNDGEIINKWYTYSIISAVVSKRGSDAIQKAACVSEGVSETMHSKCNQI